MERTLVRAMSWAIPAVTVAIALGVGFIFDVASGFLVLVTGALLGAILLLWFSLRTLAGDVPADRSLEAGGATDAPRSALDERKRRALRSLKDLEQEHAVGKIDDDDYNKLLVEYRNQAKAVIREMDDTLAPYREEAEALVRAHLKKRNIASAEERDEAEASPREIEKESARVVCSSCETVNDDDATFCKKCGAKVGAGESDEEGDEESDEDAAPEGADS